MIKILAIGNSFSQDATAYLNGIAEAKLRNFRKETLPKRFEERFALIKKVVHEICTEYKNI